MLFDTIISRTLLEKGWSDDKKYRAVDAQSKSYLLRIAPPGRLERRKNSFHRTQSLAELGIPMPQPLEFGICSEGVYTIESWIEGSDAEAFIMALPERRQYAYGMDAGKILRKIHSIPAPEYAPNWEFRFNQKIDRKIAMYENCPLKYEGGSAMLSYLASNRHLLNGRPQCYQHGDFHIGNMMIDQNGNLVIIDFDKDDWGDPWEEFNRIIWSAQAAPAFASGLVDGYFGGTVPMDFWNLLALYVCSNSLGSLPWAIPFGDGEVEVMKNQAQDILNWYDHMRKTVPRWYHHP